MCRCPQGVLSPRSGRRSCVGADGVPSRYPRVGSPTLHKDLSHYQCGSGQGREVKEGKRKKGCMAGWGRRWPFPGSPSGGSAAGLRRSPSPGSSPARVEHFLRVRLVLAVPPDGLRDIGADGREVDDVIESQVPGQDRGPSPQDTSGVVQQDSVEEAQTDALLCRLDRADPGMPVALECVRKDSVLDRDIKVGLGRTDGVSEGDDSRVAAGSIPER